MSELKSYWHFLQRSPAPVRIFVFFASILLLAAPLVIPLYRFEYEATNGKSVIWAPICLFGVFVLGLPFWGKGIHHLKKPWHILGMYGGAQWWSHWGVAFTVGSTGVAILYALQVILGWGVWMPPTVNEVVRNILEGFLVGFGVGIAEELVFRGWLLFELEQDYGLQAALWLNASFFAMAHYFRPLSAIIETWPQFLGLMLLGLTLVWARRIPIRSNRVSSSKTLLGFAAGLHGGLVWAYYQVDVGDLVLATGQVPDWITGVDGNPLAGLLGLLLLGALATATYVTSHASQT